MFAIFISCLGLFGLVLSSTEQRRKEIGIRRVNGANIGEIMFMLNRDFIKWVLLAFIVASPVAWFLMKDWLENFAYKTTDS
jgi:putative ABC transport system permease protein